MILNWEQKETLRTIWGSQEESWVWKKSPKNQIREILIKTQFKLGWPSAIYLPGQSRFFVKCPVSRFGPDLSRLSDNCPDFYSFFGYLSRFRGFSLISKKKKNAREIFFHDFRRKMFKIQNFWIEKYTF